MSTSPEQQPVAVADPCTLVIFGAGGDLSNRLLMPSLYHLAAEGRLADTFRIVGFARTDITEDALRDQFRTSIHERVGTTDETALSWLLSRFSYIKADFADDAGWQTLARRLDAPAPRSAAPASSASPVAGLSASSVSSASSAAGPSVSSASSAAGPSAPSAASAAGPSASSAASAAVLFYLATGPSQFPVVCERLAGLGLLDERHGWRRVVVEKPFGRDLASARELNTTLTGLMREDQIYRIDHYLGKETVQNILVFRFGNGIFEPIWNRRYVDHVQITVAETVGVEKRGPYYDTTGALRDMVPNHLFQLMTLTAMEPPSSFSANALHNEQAKVLGAVEVPEEAECGTATIRAQYTAGTRDGAAVPGYRHEPRVHEASLTETYAAFRLHIDNWRWAGVPFYLRTGKRLRAKRTEVVIQFRQAPLSLFKTASVEMPGANRLVLSIQPTESIELELAAKVPGPEVTASPVEMRFCYRDFFGVDTRTGYETLLFDAMVGDRSLFKRADIIESGWAIVDPILRAWEENVCDLLYYPAGSDGPDEANRLVEGDDKWKPIR